MPPCLTLSFIRYGSRVKWSNSGKEVAPSPTPRCSSYWKGSLRVALDYGRLFYFNLVHIAQSELMTSIRPFLQSINPHYKMTLCQVLSGGRQRQTVLFLTIQFSISHLFALSLNVKQMYLTHRLDPIRCYRSGPE